ncbi:hypothetical protein NDU88_003442 [Pleurodeles waltl]|uniref:Uncharacterized protein n=1 Tax=Pleurodeles waltl TaxID=8319 RepID=A0AAV7VDB6_PLEWA|nr:hypothetical protein NDU88_003442 [Pleurodeles waltl]
MSPKGSPSFGVLCCVGSCGKVKQVPNEALGLRSHWQHLRPCLQAQRQLRGLTSSRPLPGRSQPLRASGHRWAPDEPTHSERGSQGAIASGCASARRPQVAEARSNGWGAAQRRAQPRSSTAAPESKEMMSACLRRYPRGRGFPAALTSPGAAPPPDAEP